MGKPHVHKELIVAWANGAEIQRKDDDIWKDVNPAWEITAQYRIKPEREYPKTTIETHNLEIIFSNSPGTTLDGFEAIANAAIKQYIIDEEAKNG